MRVASSLPVETTRLKRMLRWLWSMAEKSDPEWVRNVTPPGTSSDGW